MDWITALQRVRERGEAAVVVTLATVRGHAPREAGAKLVVSATGLWGTIGGGNVEASVIDRARELLADPVAGTELMAFRLTDRAETTHGVQCCGGEVTVLLDPVRPRPTIAVFGLGHVGYEIAHVLARHPVHLVLVDSRAEALDTARIAPLRAGQATLDVHHAPAPEQVLRDLPDGASILVLTHDHAEDLVLCDTALRTNPVFIGLIGSRSKWQRFRTRLREEGHSDEVIDRITCPIGSPEITAKDPASIAVSVAADLLTRRDRAATKARSADGPTAGSTTGSASPEARA